MTAAAILPDDEPLGDEITSADLLEYVGHHIRTYRNRMCLSQSDLGFLVQRRTDTVSRWETGDSGISLGDLLKVSWVLQQPLSAFLPRGGDA